MIRGALVFAIFVLSGCATMCPEEEVVTTGLDRSGIRLAIRDHAVPFRHCYEKELKSKPKLAGTAIYKWTITEKGDAVDIGVQRSLDTEVDMCMISAIRATKFPPSPKGVIGVVSYPFAFSNTPPK